MTKITTNKNTQNNQLPDQTYYLAGIAISAFGFIQAFNYLRRDAIEYDKQQVNFWRPRAENYDEYYKDIIKAKEQVKTGYCTYGDIRTAECYDSKETCVKNLNNYRESLSWWQHNDIDKNYVSSAASAAFSAIAYYTGDQYLICHSTYGMIYSDYC